jgi:hypothetical protein
MVLPKKESMIIPSSYKQKKPHPIRMRLFFCLLNKSYFTYSVSAGRQAAGSQVAGLHGSGL